MPLASAKIACGLLTAVAFITSRVYGAKDFGESRALAAEEEAEYTYRTTSDATEPYGPSEWHLGYDACGGDQQSPINLAVVEETMVELSEFDLKFYPTTCDSSMLTFDADDHYKVDFSACEEAPSLSFDGDTYSLAQIHIHSVSEHRIGSTHHDAEIHMVHYRDGSDSDLLVVGVVMEATEYGDNKEISQLWSVLNIGESTTSDEVFASDIYGLLPANPYYSHYMGSLTTPPCTEGVKWIVMTEPTLMSTLQLEEFRFHASLVDHTKVDEHGNTNRPEQPLNGRVVYYAS